MGSTNPRAPRARAASVAATISLASADSMRWAKGVPQNNGDDPVTGRLCAFPATHTEGATRATEEQRELQEKLEHQDEDPDAPARSQSRHQIPDES